MMVINLYLDQEKLDGLLAIVSRNDWRNWVKINKQLAYDVFKEHIEGTGT